MSRNPAHYHMDAVAPDEEHVLLEVEVVEFDLLMACPQAIAFQLAVALPSVYHSASAKASLRRFADCTEPERRPVVDNAASAPAASAVASSAAASAVASAVAEDPYHTLPLARLYAKDAEGYFI